MAHSYRALCSDFYLNMKLAMKLELPRERHLLLLRQGGGLVRAEEPRQQHDDDGAPEQGAQEQARPLGGEHQALHDITLTIPEHCVTAFIGPSGCAILVTTLAHGNPRPTQGTRLHRNSSVTGLICMSD